jgi:hypothetical protein
MVTKMTQISISSLLKKDTKSLVFSLENENNLVINLAVNRALEARKISGGMDIDVDACGVRQTCGPNPRIPGLD